MNEQDILKYFGRENQKEKLLEEVKELKHALEWETDEEVDEEMADVLLLINQLKNDNVMRIYKQKMKRTENRIKSGYYDKIKTDEEEILMNHTNNYNYNYSKNAVSYFDDTTSITLLPHECDT